jgi:hypothetical protein
MRFVLVKGSSQYGSLRLHIDQLADALIELGEAVEVVDLIAPDPAARLIRAVQAPTECVFGFSGVGVDIAIPGKFFERPDFAYATLYVDHPVHHLERLSAPIARQAVFFLDRTHVGFVERWAKPGAFAHVGFLPPGANTLPAPVETSEAAFPARDIPLLFTGTYRGPPTQPWADWPESPARTLVADTSVHMAGDGRLALVDALSAVLGPADTELTSDLLQTIAPLLSQIQLFAEAQHRHRVLTALGHAEVPLSVYGAGWESLSQRHPSIRYGGVGSFEETLHLLRRARLVLNINNGFVAGGHERVFTAMCAGAAVLSDTSDYYAEAFEDGRDIATYDINRPQAIGGQVRALLADPGALATIASAGRDRAMAEHCWRNRAAELIAVVRTLG